LLLVVLLISLGIAVNAQINSLSHIVGGNFNRAGYRIAQGFGAWDTKTSRYVDLPYGTFAGGSVSDVAAAGNGFLVVGDFTSVNNVPANGIAYFDGTRWCSFPHLNLYTYPKPNPADNTFPRPSNQAAGFGSATAIYATGTTYYVFGGLNSATGKPRFNQVGTRTSGVAGLVRLTFDGTSNFSIDATQLGFDTMGLGSTNEYNGNGFPADTAPSTTIGTTKLRVINSGGQLSFYVHPNVGSFSQLFRWRQNDGAWLTVTQTTATQFNVSSNPTTFNVLATALSNRIKDFDVDVSNNVIFVAGAFDNTANTTGSVQYLHVASSSNAHTTSVTWGKTANWNNNTLYQNTIGASAITVVNQNQYYVALPFNRVDTIYTPNQYYVHVVNSGTPSFVGGRFARADGSAPNIRKLMYFNNKPYAFGDFSLIDFVLDTSNLWPRRYYRKISGAVSFDGTNWVDAYGGFSSSSTTTSNLAGVAVAANGIDYVWLKGATNFYDVFSSGGLVAYNTKTYKWVNLASQRFTVRNGDNGDDGNVNAIHFIKKQRDGVTDAVVIGGNFDWFGTQYLGSVAFLRTSTNTLEQLGGGVFVDETTPKYTADQITPIYRAGTVYDIEEVNGNFYVGGSFTKNIEGKCLGNLASVSVTGGVFAQVGAGCDGTVWDLLVNGDKLFVGGDFNSCNGIQGTRRIAQYDTKKGTFSALSTGFSDGRVFAMIMWKGDLLAGGSFTQAPASYRSAGATGLYKWNGKRWSPLFGKCQKDCDQGEFTAPFSGSDPLLRSVNSVKSLRVIGSNLYIQGQIPNAAGTDYLIQYDGSYFRQYGVASGNTGCIKQGCLASNQSLIIGAGFSRPGSDAYNNNFETYNPDYKNWVDTFTGFDVAPVLVASSSFLTYTVFTLLLVLFFAF